MSESRNINIKNLIRGKRIPKDFRDADYPQCLLRATGPLVVKHRVPAASDREGKYLEKVEGGGSG